MTQFIERVSPFSGRMTPGLRYGNESGNSARITENTGAASSVEARESMIANASVESTESVSSVILTAMDDLTRPAQTLPT